MREFEVFKITDHDKHFKVEIEYSDNREREFFAFPKTQDWFREIAGVPRYLVMINSRLANRAATSEPDEEYKTKLDANIAKVQGKKFRMNAMGTMAEVKDNVPSFPSTEE